jgi:hypothetical protein
MKNMYLLSCLLFCAVLFLSCNRTPYQKFIHHSKDYYQRIAIACDKLIIQSEQAPKTWRLIKSSLGMEYRIDGSDSSIPKAIRDLQPQEVNVYLYSKLGCGVGVLVGSSKSGYGFSWGKENVVSDVWVLAVGNETEPIPPLYKELKKDSYICDKLTRELK